jgi:hypothetical protein
VTFAGFTQFANDALHGFLFSKPEARIPPQE